MTSHAQSTEQALRQELADRIGQLPSGSFLANPDAPWDAIFLLRDDRGRPVTPGYGDYLAWHFACFIPKSGETDDDGGAGQED